MNLGLDDAAQRLTDSEFSTIQKIALQDAGLMLPLGKRSMVESRLARRMRLIGCSSLADYLGRLSGRDSLPERRALVSVLTTNVTSFFREGHHFETLRNQVFPSLLEKANAGKRVRLWSAGCSSGQEAFSIAMLLKAMDGNVEEKDIRILATDIDDVVLERARQATYAASELGSIPEDIRREMNLLHQTNEDFEITSEVKKMVTFKSLNLHGAWPMRGQFDVIFCRNVVIYFDLPRQTALWPRFNASLASDGWLFLGHSERIHPLEGSGFEGRGVTTYQKSEQTNPTTVSRTGAH